MVEMSSPLPMGLLRIRPRRAGGLLAADINLLGKASSDPFVEIRLADQMWRSHTVSKSLSPEFAVSWADTKEMLVYRLRSITQSFLSRAACCCYYIISASS